MKGADYYKQWKADPKNATIVRRLEREGDGDISVKTLEQNEPYWSIGVGEKKCACHPHTGVQYACKALTLWRRLQHADCNCGCANCGGRPDSDEHRKFFAATADCSALGDLVSCAHEATTSIRPLDCMLHHDHWLAKFATCPAEEESSDSLPPVKFLKSEPSRGAERGRRNPGHTVALLLCSNLRPGQDAAAAVQLLLQPLLQKGVQGVPV